MSLGEQKVTGRRWELQMIEGSEIQDETKPEKLSEPQEPSGPMS